MNILIVGGSHAGVTAALHLKAVNPEVKVTIIEKNTFSSFIASGINLLAKKIVTNLKGAALYHKEDILASGIEIIDEASVVKLSKRHKLLTILHDKSQEKEELPYDYVILATGSHQIHLNFGYEDDPRFLSYKNISESQRSYPLIKNAKHIAIIGAGFIGLELADWLKEEKQVTVIERMERPLFRYFDDKFLEEVFDGTQPNLTLEFNNAITQVEDNNGKLTLHLLSGKTIEDVDCVVSAINGLPNTEIFEGFIDLNFDKTVLVNKHLQTSLPYVYAIGDIIGQPLVNNRMRNNRFFLPLVSNALRSAHVAAENILTDNALPFEPSNRTIVSLFGPYYLASSGMNELDLLTHPAETKTYTKTFAQNELDSLSNNPKGYVKVKLTYEKDTMILLGGQIIATDPALIQNINMISVMIHTKLTISKIAQMDFFFQPELKPFQNIIQHVALEIIIKKRL